MANVRTSLSWGILLLSASLTACSTSDGSAREDDLSGGHARLAGDYPESFRSGDHTIPGGQIARGDSLYNVAVGFANCIVCHGPYLTGGSHGTNLRDAEWHHTDGTYASIVRVIAAGVDQSTHSPIPRMPPMGGFRLSDDDVRALAAYVSWFSSTRAAWITSPGGAVSHQHSGG